MASVLRGEVGVKTGADTIVRKQGVRIAVSDIGTGMR